MYVDKRLTFSSAQALTATAVGTDVVDFGHSRPVGPGEPLWLVVVAKVGLGGVTPTLTVSLEADDNSGFASAAIIAQGQQLAAADFPTGKICVLPMPLASERYLRTRFTLGGTTPTATVDAFLTGQDPTAWSSFPDGL